jgi:hypothetical protein
MSDVRAAEEGARLRGRTILSDALAASGRVVDLRREIDLLQVNRSLTMSSGHDEQFLATLLRRQKCVVIGGAAVGCLLLVGLYVIAQKLGGLQWGAAGRPLWLAGAAACLVGAVLCFLVPAMSADWFYRPYLQTRVGELRASPLHFTRPRFVQVEYPQIFADSPGVVSDVGYLSCAAGCRRIIIEGVLLRHLIRAEDVSRVELVASEQSAGPVDLDDCRSLQIHVEVGDGVELIIGVIQDSLIADVMQKYLGRETLFAQIRKSLSTDSPVR